MSRHPFGWDLPPGVTQRHIDEAAGAYDEPAEEEEGRVTDFRVFNHGSVWTIQAVSDAAKAFAEEFFAHVEPWQGRPDNFTTDWRAARDLREQLIIDQDFNVESA